MEQIKVGDFVTFKRDIELSGKVTAIVNGQALVKVWDSDRGEYEIYHVSLHRCSKE